MGPHHRPHPWGGHGGGDLWLLWPVIPAFLIVLVIVLVLLWALLRSGTVGAVVDGAGSRVPIGSRARWRAAVAGHAEVARSFAAYECDPEAVLRLPALADVRQPATARFIEA